MKHFKILLLLMVIASPLWGQSKIGDRWVDNNLSFMVPSEKVKARGMMEICIADSTGNCVQNLLSGFVVRIFDEAGNELWAGKTAGRERMLRFPKPMPKASYVEITAFKPFVLNLGTGTRIYQDEPMHLKYSLE